MKIINFIILSLVIGLCSCQDKSSKTTAGNSDSISSMKMASDTNGIIAATDSTGQSKSDWKGTYKGMIPGMAADVIETEIVLHADNTYTISTKTVGSKHQEGTSRESKGEGKFTWVNESTIQLADIKSGPSIYEVEENTLLQLDSLGKKRSGADAANYILTKK